MIRKLYTGSFPQQKEVGEVSSFRVAAGFLKLLFPDMNSTREQFNEFCINPAVSLRQHVHDELHKLDPEYAKVSIDFV